jgi:Ca2+/Na+ antiporter
LRFFRAFDRLLYPLTVSGDSSEDNKTEYRFVLGLLLGVCSAWVLTDISFGIDGHIKYSVGMLVGVMMLSYIFKTIIIWDIECRFGLGTLLGVCSAWVLIDSLPAMSGHIKYSAGMLVGVMLIFQCRSSKFAPISSSASKHGTIDPAEMWC